MKLLLVITTVLLSFNLVAGENLVKNGNFDQGEPFASHWERADGLCSFFVQEKGRGRIVKMDSQVELRQALNWMKAFKANPKLKPPKKKPIAKSSYGTIGGGRWCYARFRIHHV